MKPNPDFKIGDVVRFSSYGGVPGDNKFILIGVGRTKDGYATYSVADASTGRPAGLMTMIPGWTIHHVFNALQRLKKNIPRLFGI
jgi:hypothetical protein